ncbi:T-cell surface glycoprotein CD8 alpha chain [Thomomys bottae]
MASPGTIRLLSLTLLLHATAAQRHSQFLMTPRKAVAELGKKMELGCQFLGNNQPSGCSWLYQGAGAGASPTFLLYVSPTRIRMAKGLSPRFSGAKAGNVFHLTVSQFRLEDQGYYFCALVGSGEAAFSPFVPVFLPATTTAPAPRPSTQAPPTTTWQPVTRRPDLCGHKAGGTVDARWPDFECDVYIWVPVAGLCAVLLLSVVTTLLCYHRNRRHVCKCPRPLVRQGGKPSPSGRYN